MKTLKNMIKTGNNFNVYSKMVIFYGLLWAVGIAVMSCILIGNNNPPDFNFYAYMAAQRYLDISRYIAVLAIMGGFLFEMYITLTKNDKF